MKTKNKLPLNYLSTYAGKSFKYDGIWTCQKDCDFIDNFDGKTIYSVIIHETAQFDFAIDENLAIYVGLDQWLKLYNCIQDLEDLSNFESQYVTSPKAKRENLGYYSSIKEFEEKNYSLLEGAKSYSPIGDENNKLYVVKGVPLYLGLTYEQDRRLVALKGN